MSSMHSRNYFLLIPGWILTVMLVAVGVIQSGNPAHLVDLSEFLFVLMGGIALIMISFPGAEIRQAFLHAVRVPENDTAIRTSAHFWEAAGRGFWIAGVVRSVLQLILFFNSIGYAGEYAPSIQPAINEMARYLLSTLYGALLALVCFIPFWKLAGKLQPIASTIREESMSIGRHGWRFGLALGYVLFISFLVSCFLKLIRPVPFLIAFKPAMFVVVGGTIALMLLMRGANSRPALSTAFAGMGLIGFLIGSIQMQGHVAGAFAFLLSSCLTALLGMALVGAPFEDRAIRMGRLAAPSACSRVAWYVFPLVALVCLLPMLFMLFQPAPLP
jgi:hypothetical protein